MVAAVTYRRSISAERLSFFTLVSTATRSFCCAAASSMAVVMTPTKRLSMTSDPMIKNPMKKRAAPTSMLWVCSQSSSRGTVPSSE